MEDRIEGIAYKENVYKFLDKFSSYLNKSLKAENFLLKKITTVKGIQLRIRLVDSNIKDTFVIDVDNVKGIVNIIFLKDTTNIPPSVGSAFIYKHGFTFATLYKDNSISCKNFLDQCIIENNNIEKNLEDIIDEIDKLNKCEIKNEDLSFNKVDNKPSYENKKWWHKIFSI